MSFVTTAPAAISAAATQLEGVGNSFATESAGAAGSTTAISPAAADEVSILQSGVFSTYGQLYQTVSAQAQAIHQQFVNPCSNPRAPTKRPKEPTRPGPPLPRWPTAGRRPPRSLRKGASPA